MTTISMERLIEMPHGATVTVGQQQQTWTIADGGLQFNGFTVPVDQFASQVRAGLVREGVPWRNEQLWQNSTGGRYFYVVNAEGGKVDGVWFRSNGTFLQMEMGRENQHGLTLVNDERPEWLSFAVSAAYALWSQQRDIATLQTRQQEVAQVHQQQTTSLRESYDARWATLGERLVEFVEQDMNEDLLTILRDSGLPLPQQTVDVTLEVTGQSTCYFESDELQERAPEGCEVTSGAEARIEWERTITYQREVDHGECACEDMSRSEVYDAVRAAGVADWYDLDWSSTCENC